ncbi:MAG: glycosyltransferase family 2 protein, partial [Clostridia bacterium]|nr:glycosyltransferase family 2 protein [Clostridia bacterium]
NSKNYGTNLISGLYGMYFSVGCRLESCGRTVLGCSTRVQGTGYLISYKVVKNGWPYVTLTEDWEFTADQILFDNNIRYCDAAVFYDEQPTSVKIMWRQRVRWSRGHLLVFYARFCELFRHLFKKETRHRVSLYDITAYILPSTLLLLCFQALQVILFLTAPLIDSSVTLKSIFLGDSLNFFLSNGALFSWMRSALISYGTMLLMAIVVFIADRKRIRGVGLIKKILITLLWPFFLYIQLPIDIQAFFSPHLGWKPIPHDDDTSHDEVNQG